MVRTYLDAVQPVADETITHEGGTAYVADLWLRLRRFLILGTSGGTFYVGERELTIESLDAVRACLAADGPRTVREIVAVGESGRAPKHDPVLFALALATTADDLATRRAAFAAVPSVCRTGTHILHFAAYRRSLAGWGRGAKQAVGRWFTAKTADDLAYQAIKYPSRDGWALSDLLRLSHPKSEDTALDAVFAWIVDGAAADATKLDALPEQIKARDWLQAPEHRTTEHRPHEVIRRLRLPREALPSELLNDPETWEALLADMPVTAMVRNLGKMSQVGLLTDGSAAARTVRDRLGDVERLRRGRVHPIPLLSALKVYEQGQGERGKLTWKPVKSVATALDEGFYRCLVPETRILTADLRWVPLEDIQVGQKLVAVDEEIPGGSGPQRKMRTATVQDRWESQVPTFRVSFADGREVIASGNHRFLSRQRARTATAWRAVQDMRPGDVIRWVTRPWGEPTIDDGWMGGLIDGEGHLRTNGTGARVQVAQAAGVVLDRARTYLHDRGYPFTESNGDSPSHAARMRPVHVLSVSRMDETFRLVGQTGAVRWKENSWWNGKGLPGKSTATNCWEEIVAIEPAGIRRVIDIQTSTGTFIAEGFVSHNSFQNIEPSNKRILCAVDVSGSMMQAAPGLVGLTCRDLAAAMALVTLATEPQAEIVGYSDRIVQLPLRPTMRLDEIVRTMGSLPSGWTYCALPIHHALERGRVYDAIVQYTDSESSDGIPDNYRQVGSKGRTGTYATLLRKYRQRTGTATRSVVTAFAANEISLADPTDPLALDVAGFDASGPGVIAEFIAGKI